MFGVSPTGRMRSSSRHTSAKAIVFREAARKHEELFGRFREQMMNRNKNKMAQIQSNIVFMEAARKAKELKEAKEEAKAKAAATPETAAPTHCHGTERFQQ